MWAPLVCAGPLTASLRGLWVGGLLPPGNGGTNEGAATLKPTKCRRELTHNSRAGNAKRSRPNCHSKEVLSNQRGSHHCTKCSYRAKYPGVAAPLASAGCRGNFLRIVDGRLGKIVLPTFIYSRLCFYESAGERPAPRGCCWSALSGGQEAEGR